MTVCRIILNISELSQVAMRQFRDALGCRGEPRAGNTWHSSLGSWVVGVTVQAMRRDKQGQMHNRARRPKVRNMPGRGLKVSKNQPIGGVASAQCSSGQDQRKSQQEPLRRLEDQKLGSSNSKRVRLGRLFSKLAMHSSP
ncbi:hypothetical protein NDU88_006492 [Pleurodeles waltl]|uniref:Uncharacterized protein n=1 Tax=Pleurodeles waltl TaxID=8319 RepID=A0AAV7SQ08_PLEWA|nr:hypothetical protein NDU88_006492 [Pleurodeles waltl]